MTSDSRPAARGWAAVGRILGASVVLAALAGCHPEAGEVPLADDTRTLRDRWLDVATVDGITVIVAGDRGKILRSENGGETWSRVATPTDRALTRLAFADRENGWAVGQDGTVLRTRDGGVTWKAQESGTESHLFGVSAVDPETAVACGDRSAWLATHDGGRTWRAAAIPLSGIGLDPGIALAVEEPIYYDVTLLENDTAWAVGDYGNIRVTRDGGRTWEARHGSLLGQQMPGMRRPLRDALDLPALFRIAMGTGGHGFAVGVGGIVLRTGDAGRTWSFEMLGVDPPVEAPLFEIGFAGGGVFLFGGGGTALVGHEGGWRRLELRLPLLTWLAAADFADEGALAGRRGFVVGGRGMILRSDDAGTTWRAAAPPGAGS